MVPCLLSRSMSELRPFRNFWSGKSPYDTEHSYTFHGRDVYACCGAKLAKGHISFEEVGPELKVGRDVEIVLVDHACGYSCSRSYWYPDVRSALTSATHEEIYTLKTRIWHRFEVTYLLGCRHAGLSKPSNHGSLDVRHRPAYPLYQIPWSALAINQGSFAKVTMLASVPSGILKSRELKLRKKNMKNNTIRNVVATGMFYSWSSNDHPNVLYPINVISPIILCKLLASLGPIWFLDGLHWPCH